MVVVDQTVVAGQMMVAGWIVVVDLRDMADWIMAAGPWRVAAKRVDV